MTSSAAKTSARTRASEPYQGTAPTSVTLGAAARLAAGCGPPMTGNGALASQLPVLDATVTVSSWPAVASVGSVAWT